MFWRRRNQHWTGQDWVSILARYNSEVAHGIVHTEEWKARMVVLQERFDKASAEERKGL